MKDLKRIDPTYKLDKLPKLKSHCFSYLNTVGYSGSIFRRKIKGPAKLYWHYAFIYGFDINNQLLLIENNEDGVECITWRDFNPENITCECVHTEPNIDNFEKIIARAKRRMKYPYHWSNNNCEHLVNYSVWGNLKSEQTDNTKSVVNAGLLYFEMRFVNTIDPAVPMVLDYDNKIRKALDIKRGAKEIDEVISKRIGSFKSNPVIVKSKVVSARQYRIKKQD